MLNYLNFIPVEWLISRGIKILLILVVSWLIYAVFRKASKKIVRFVVTQNNADLEKRAKTLRKVLVKTVQVVIIIIAGLMILSELNVNITPILTGAGLLGLAVSFGSQSLVKDFIHGLFILMENQFAVGEKVKIENITGVVEEMNLRRVLIRGEEGVLHSIPNNRINVVSNYTRK